MPQPQPTFRRPDANDMIPPVIIRAMIGLALVSLLLVAWARATDRPLVGVPPSAEAVRERTVTLIGGGAQAVTVLDENGAVLADLAHGGFVTVIQNGLQRVRKVHGLPADLPVRIVEYANGRLTIHDDVTGWSVELGAFGADNRAAWERLMDL
jgi:putative photosynthetic complex assembly protein